MHRFVLMISLALCCGVSERSFAADAEQPWLHAQVVLDIATQDIKASGGIRGIEKDVPDLEAALSQAIPSETIIAIDLGDSVVLTDGMPEALIASVAAQKNGKHVAAIATPYPVIALYLGSYYNEIGKPEDALHALNAGIAASDTREFRPRRTRSRIGQ